MTATVIVAGVVGWVVSGCTGMKPPSQYLVINGVVEVASSPPPSGTVCLVAPSLADVTRGAQVLVTDASGSSVGQGTLMPTNDWTPCNLRYDFQVVDIPAGRGPYGLEMPGHGRVLFGEEALRGKVIHLSAS